MMCMRRSPMLLAVLLATCLPAWGRGGGKKAPAAFPEHVVCVILGGGVRAADMLDAERMPTLAAMAASGAVVRDVLSEAPNGYSAVARILTGCAAVLDGSVKPRPHQPTLCEVVRAARDLAREQVWFVSFEGEDQLHLAWSQHESFGEVVAPAVAHGQGPFAHPMRSFLERLGRPLPMEAGTWTLLRRLRLLGREAAAVYLPRDVHAGLPRAERVERALLRELDRKALLNRGPNPRDEQALRAAMTVLEVHRPVLTVVRLGEAERGQASFAEYLAVLKANDTGLARLRATVAADARMGGRTTFVVVGDRGRNAEPDAQGRLGADDASKQRRYVCAVLTGPGLRRRPRVEGPRRLEDLAPTLAHLLGVEMAAAAGRTWQGLLQRR